MFYKIVDSEYKSFNSSPYPYENCVSCIQYKKMKWAKPKYECAPLCVFDSLDSAKDFIGHINLAIPIKANYRIFECIIEKSNIKWGFCHSPSEIKSNIDLYYNDYLNYHPDISNWPKGTVFANKVMLVKDIKSKSKQTYYKVVDYNCRSISKESRLLNLCMEYKIGEWVIPDNPIAPLMVFDNLEDARNFCHNYGNSQVYSCDIVKSKRKWGYLYSKDWDSYIKAKQHKKKFNFEDLPEGTIFADAVKLIERV